MSIIAILNQKGGVGKTTTTINLGIGLSMAGKKTMIIDMDPQANLTHSLAIDPYRTNGTIFNVLRGDRTISEVVIEQEDTAIIPASLDLSAAEIELSGIPGREFLLRDALQDHKDSEYIILDCPPSLGLLTLNALTAADEVVIPIQTEFLALQGVSTLLKTMEIVRKRLNRNIRISGVLATRFDSRRNLNKDVIENLKSHFGEIFFNTIIRENIALAEAPSHGKSIYTYNSGSNGAQDYRQLVHEYLERNEHNGKEKQAGA